MAQGPFEFLKSTPEDHNFHAQRIMFWIVDGQVQVGPIGTSMSHLEMAESMGWLNGNSCEQFFGKNPRGFYLKTGNRVHFYWGVGFGFDNELKKQIISMLPQIRESLDIEDTTEVFFGPKDSPINGIKYPIESVGTIKHLIVRK